MLRKLKCYYTRELGRPKLTVSLMRPSRLSFCSIIGPFTSKNIIGPFTSKKSSGLLHQKISLGHGLYHKDMRTNLDRRMKEPQI